MGDTREHKPYTYQVAAFKHILEGKNLLIQAPTGGGKTRAALEPGIQALYQGQFEPDRYPPRIVYGVPMRVLARSFYDEYEKLAKAKSWRYEWHPSIQTGEQPTDAQFESRVIFATVDQMLASFLCLPYGLPRRLGNVSPGALIGSYLIFDEFHLYPQRQMMLTVLAMLVMLKDVSRFTLMTATFSQPLLARLADLLGAETLADPPDTPLATGLFSDVTNIQTQQRTWKTHEGQLTADAAQALIGDAMRALCTCNTVDRAQELYRNLRERMPNHEVVLLHSRFYRHDRRKLENLVQKRLGKETQPGDLQRPFVLVATQVVEVGLDLSSDVLITECAPASSLIQRAGRCARRAGEAGEVHVFQPYSLNDDGELEVSYAPYLKDGMEDVCLRTWEALNTCEMNKQVLRFPEEQNLINRAHGPADQAFIAALDAMIKQRIEEITRCQANPDPGWLGPLIRENFNVPLTIDPDPNRSKHLTTRPWRCEAFSLSKRQIARLFNTANEVMDDGTILWGGKEERADPDSSGAQSTYVWTELGEAGEAYGKLWRFNAHPDAVSYDNDMGLILAPGSNSAPPSPEAKEPPWERPAYHAERYWEHIAGLFMAYTASSTAYSKKREGDVSYTGLRQELMYPLRRLCEGLKLDVDTGEKMLRLALALHDVGKLNEPWQAWARAWQVYYAQQGYDPGLPVDDPAPLAHTTLDRNDEAQRELEKAFTHAPRGTHAVEGAAAVYRAVLTAADGHRLWVAVTLASIMHHHTTDASQSGAFVATPSAHQAVETGLLACGFSQDESQALVEEIDLAFQRSPSVLRKIALQIIPAYHSYTPALLYYLFVRVLRLADQRSGLWWQRYRDTNVNPLHQLEGI